MPDSVSYNPGSIEAYQGQINGLANHVQDLFHQIGVHHDNLTEETAGGASEARQHTQQTTQKFDAQCADFHTQFNAVVSRALEGHVHTDAQHAATM